MQDYIFEYKGDSYRVPKNKIFECLYEIAEVVPLSDMQTLANRSQALKAARIFCAIGSYADKKFDPISVSQDYLHSDEQMSEIYVAIGGVLSLLNPPESYNPPETKEVGK